MHTVVWCVKICIIPLNDFQQQAADARAAFGYLFQIAVGLATLYATGGVCYLWPGTGSANVANVGSRFFYDCDPPEQRLLGLDLEAKIG